MYVLANLQLQLAFDDGEVPATEKDAEVLVFVVRETLQAVEPLAVPHITWQWTPGDDVVVCTLPPLDFGKLAELCTKLDGRVHSHVYAR
jgi:hypothetical protein